MTCRASYEELVRELSKCCPLGSQPETQDREHTERLTSLDGAARDCSLQLEGFDHIRSHAQTASRLEEELGRESTECSAVGTPLDTPRVQCTLSDRVESPISNRANAVQPAAVVSKQQEDLARWFRACACH